ncbi:NUDIX domain-containing protein [Anaerolineales bacterium HSG25]|nr:NUDIX domain-containing protein [Anaerolineales bacterium HSG25]
MSKPRHRAVAIILDKDNKILVMYRNRKGRGIYYVFPGGGIEPGETPEQACLREIKEETNLQVTLSKKLFTFENRGNLEHYFLTSHPQGQLKLGGPELLELSAENQYRLEWIPLTELSKIDIFPCEVVVLLLEYLINPLKLRT